MTKNLFLPTLLMTFQTFCAIIIIESMNVLQVERSECDERKFSYYNWP